MKSTATERRAASQSHVTTRHRMQPSRLG